MKALPPGWTTATIRQLCTLENGRAFKPTDWTEHGLPIVRIQNLNREGASFNRFDGEVAERYRLRGGELLFAWSGTPGTSFGAHVWRGGDAVLNQHIFRVDFDEAFVDKRFFRHAINQKLEELISVAHGGVGLRHVTKGVFEGTEVLVPPLAEQRRIADKLDALLARVEACRGRLDRVPGILKRFQQSVLAAAISGELTRDWRDGAEALWAERPIEQLCLNERYALSIGPFGSNLKVSDYRDTGVPLVFVREIRARQFGGGGTKYVAHEKATELNAHSVRPGDLLITKMGDPPGDTAIYPLDRPLAIMTADVVCMRVDPHLVDARFVGFAIESPLGRERIGGITAGVAQQKISLERFRRMQIPVPPLSEQVEIARRVGDLLAAAARIERAVGLARERVNRATPSALAKAFRGELVPRSPIHVGSNGAESNHLSARHATRKER